MIASLLSASSIREYQFKLQFHNVSNMKAKSDALSLWQTAIGKGWNVFILSLIPTYMTRYPCQTSLYILSIWTILYLHKFFNDPSSRKNYFQILFINIKVRPHLHANTNVAGRGEAYTNICLDCNTRQNVVVRRASEWFSLKYRLQADSVLSSSDQTEAVFLSSVTRLHCYACLALACLTHFFVLM